MTSSRAIQASLVCGPLALALGLGACGRMDVDEAAANEAADSTEVTQSESALVASSVQDDTTSSLSAADLAAAAAARGATRFHPAGCATVAVSSTTLTYVLTDCTGRFGLVHVTGTLVAVLSDGTDGLHIAVSGQGLKVNRATMDLDATAVLSDDAGKRKLVVTTNGSGVGPRGNSFTRTGNYTVERDLATACISLDGQWALQVGARTRTTSVTGFQRCDNMCPAAGGQIVHSGFLGRTVTVTLDGSAVAQWQSSSGRSGTVDLTCL